MIDDMVQWIKRHFFTKLELFNGVLDIRYYTSAAIDTLLLGYALLAGRSGGQTLKGGTASGEDLTLMSTAHATKGSLFFGTSAYDEVNNRLGIGTASPGEKLHVAGDIQVGDPAGSTAGSYEINMPEGASTVNSGNGRELYIIPGASDNEAGKRGGHLYLRTGVPSSPATAYGNVIIADQGGQVGIGVTPSHKLDVSDRSRFRSGSSGTAGIWLSDSTPTDRAFIGLYDDDATPVTGIYNG
jgi:hypothetical protein